MTFESMIENININADNEPLSVKVSYGDELRRTTFNGTSYEALRDAVAKLFGLDVASVVLRYQDDDGDKITMSTDGELVDALRGAKEKKLLRLFVDVKVAAAPVAPEEVPAPAPAPADAGDYFNHPFAARRFGGPLRGGFRGPFGYGPHRGGPHHGPHHGGPHGHHGGPHGHGPHGPGSHHGPHHGFGPHHAGPHGHPHGPHPPHGPHHAGPDGQQPPFPPHFGRGGPYGDPWAHKAHKHAMKEHKHAMKEGMKEQKHAFKAQIKLMKENATTPDDFLAIKEYKQQMRAEWKNQWQQGKHCGDKFDKYDKKKCEKKCKKDKKDKKDRFIAKHVADVTIPDNSELPADTPATKTWRLRNVGTTAWPADSQLIFISRRGDNLNGPEKVNVGAVEPQQEIDVSLTFITPSEPGRYIGYYRMATADGAKFGQRVWVSFLIPHTPVATPTSPLVNVTYTTTTISSPLAGDIAMD